MTELKNFIDAEEIEQALARKNDQAQLRAIIEKCKDPEYKGLTLNEVAALINNTDPEIDEEMFDVARQVKQHIYGNRMVLFAPLYVSNTCVNNCLYCGFRADNKDLRRIRLNRIQLQREVETLQKQGHKRVLMVYGETPYKPQELVDDILAAYEVKTAPSGEIRRINVNIAPMSVEDFKVLATANIGTFQCFQETYHLPTYNHVHISGKKTDYLYRLYAHHRSMEAGIEDVGMGALYGLYDYKFETLAVIKHAQVLERDMGVGPHTISFPRLEPAQNSEMSFNPPHKVTDEQMKRIIAITRLALPYVGMIISTREPPKLRMELLKLGISQLSGGSKVSPGTYSEKNVNFEDKQQFHVADERSLDEVIYDIVTNLEYIPSFCTGCYRKKRVGEHFMGLAKRAFIKDYCFPNAVFTFSEYLRDYATPQTKEAGYQLIKKLLDQDKQKEKILENLKKINEGANDIFY